jgi:hypothetical protein
MTSFDNAFGPTRNTMDPLTIAAIGGTAFNAISQIGTNRKNRQHQKDMYDLQRKHAVEDRDFMLDYNDPKNYRKRMEEAGFHPLAGQGINQQAPVTRAAQAPSGNAQAAQLDAAQIIQAQQLGQQTQIMKAQERKINAEAEAQEFENQTKKYVDSGNITEGGNIARYRLQELRDKKREYELKLQSMDPNSKTKKAEYKKLLNDIAKQEKVLTILDKEIEDWDLQYVDEYFIQFLQMEAKKIWDASRLKRWIQQKTEDYVRKQKQ